MSDADGGKRVALVTGSSRGIGRALVEHLLASNFDVHGVSRSENHDLTSESYTHHVCDLQDAESIQKVFSTLRKNGVQLDTVVNNAGVLTSQYAMILSPEAAKDMVLTNLWAPFVVSREAARLMRKTGWGRIVHIGSMAPTLEAEGDSVYAACKAGLQMLSNVMAREFSSLNITSNGGGIGGSTVSGGSGAGGQGGNGTTLSGGNGGSTPGFGPAGGGNGTPITDIILSPSNNVTYSISNGGGGVGGEGNGVTSPGGGGNGGNGGSGGSSGTPSGAIYAGGSGGGGGNGGQNGNQSGAGNGGNGGYITTGINQSYGNGGGGAGFNIGGSGSNGVIIIWFSN